MEKTVKRHAEFEALRKYGMRWAVLLSLSFDLSQKKVTLPSSEYCELHEKAYLNIRQKFEAFIQEGTFKSFVKEFLTN